MLLRPLSQERHTGLGSRFCAGIAAAIQILAAPRAPAESVRITGRLAAWNDEPVADVEVSLRADASLFERAVAALEDRAPAPDLASSRTDDEGLFSLTAPGPGFWELVARHGDITASRKVIAESSRELGTWMAPRVRTIEAEVRDAEGRPLRGARVELAWASANDDPIPDEDRRANTDERGRATVRAPRQRARLLVYASGMAPTVEHLPAVTTTAPGETPPTERRVIRLVPVAHRRLHVHEPDGAPARGALWLYDGVALARSDDEGRMLVPVRESAGRFARPQIWSPTLSSFRIGSLAAAPGARRREGAGGAQEARLGEAPELELRLEPPAVVSGVVRDGASSAAIGGALVFHPEGGPRAIADRDGSFEVRWPRSLGRRDLVARADGYLDGHWSGRTDEAGGSADGVVVELRPGAPLVGVVVDQATRPVAGAEVFTRKASARTSTDGRFRLPPFDRARPLLVTVAHPQFAVLVQGLAPEDLAQPEVRLVLTPGRDAAGWVVDDRERPLGAARVWLQPFGREFHSLSMRFVGRWSSETDSEGRYQLGPLAPGAYTVMVEREGFAPAAVPGVVIPPADGADGPAELGTVVLAPGHMLDGVARTRERAPVAGVHVSLMQSGSSPLWREATTGADGRFSLRDLPASSSLTLFVEAPPGWLQLEVPRQVTVPRAEPIELVFEPAIELTGRVEDRDGEPIAGASVSARRLDEANASGLGTSAGADGSFVLPALRAGVYELRADASAFLPGSRRGIELRAGRETEPVVLVLDQGATLSGRVTDDEGAPVENAYVHVRSPNGSDESRVRTDADGRYRAEGLPVGPASASASIGRTTGATREVTIEAGDNELDLVVTRPKVFVSGRVIDADGAPAHYAAVTATVNGGVVASSPALDAEFALPVEPGVELELVATVRGQSASLPVSVRVEQSSVEGIVLELQPAGTVRGRVVGLGIDRLARVGISPHPRDLTSPGYSTSAVRVDFEGRFLLEGLAPGRWEIRAEEGIASRRVLAREEVTLAPGAETEVILDATEGDLVLSGVVTRAREPVAGASVRLTAADDIGSGSTLTSNDGTFEFRRLRDGHYRVAVDLESSIVHSEELDLHQDQHLSIELPSTTITGLVVRRATQEPVAWAGVSLDQSGGGSPGIYARTRTDARGAFRFEGVPDGTHRLVATEGEGRASAEVLVSGLDLEVTLELETTPGLVLIVAGPDGRQPAQVQVEARDVHGRHVLGGRYTAGEGGRVEVRDLPAGRWLVRVSDETAVALVAVTVPGDPVSVQLALGGHLEITVAAGRPVYDGERVELVRAATRAEASEIRQAFLRYGRARVGPLQPGPWTLRLRRGDQVLEVAVRVEPGAVVKVEL